MAFLERIKSLFGMKAAANPPDYGQYAYGNPYNYGNFYSPYQYWQRPSDHRAELGHLDANSLVMCVVNYTGTRLPEARPAVVTKGENGKDRNDFFHPVAQLIRRPNQHFIWANYCMALSLSWWIDGNVYFLKTRSLRGVEQLWYLPHFLVMARWPNDGRAPEVPLNDQNGQPNDPVLSHYQYSIPGKVPILYPKEDVVHIKRGVNMGNVRSGIGAFEPLITELYGDHAMAKFTATIMRNMGIQVPVISPKDKEVAIDETDALRMKEGWMRKTTGEAAGEPVILTEPIDIEKFGFNPTELDLSKLRLIPESRVAAVTGIPAATLQLMVGLQNGTSYASSVEAREQGYEEVVIPIQRAIAEEINWQVLPDFGEPTTSEFTFDTSEVMVLQEDQDALTKRATVAYLGGVAKRSEARQLLGLEVTADDEVFFEPRGSGVIKEGEDPTAASTTLPGAKPPVPAKFGNYADIDRYLNALENSMKGFIAHSD